MKQPPPVLIDNTGGHYRLTQGQDLLLRVPAPVFERFNANCVFPLLWANPEIHPVRRFYWNPDTLEFLLFGLDEQTVRFGDTFGPSGYRSFLQGFWAPTPPLLLLRPYWRPEDPYDPFDAAARLRSFEVQQAFLSVVGRLRPPEGWMAVLNAVEPYLDALGVNAQGLPGEPGEILEVSLTPPASLKEPTTAALLRSLATDQAGDCFPLLRQGALIGVHTLGLRELHAAQATIAAAGLDCREGPPHLH